MNTDVFMMGSPLGLTCKKVMPEILCPEPRQFK